MKKTLFQIGPALAILAMLVASCEKEPVVGEIVTTIDGYSVTFSVDVKHGDSWSWDFGDGNTSTEAAPVHEYARSGSYTVALTVSGRGGETQATTQVVIAPSVAEMLTGGLTAANGKTWVLSSGYTEGMDGASAIDNSMLVMLPSVENVLGVIGLGEEYDNEYTFYSDGRYTVVVKNGIALISGLYGTFTGTTVNVGNDKNTLGIYGATWSPPASATWTLHSEDLVVDALINPLGTEVPALHENIAITGKKWVTLSEGAFFGVLDYPTTRKFIIKEITPDRMYVALFICGYFADENAWSIPGYLFHMTFVPKS